MTKEQEEAILNIKIFIKSIRSDLTEESKDNQKLADDIEKVLNMLKENSAELAEKSAEIEKYKSLYNKALEDLVKAEKKNMQKDKQRDLMLKYINYLSDELVQATGRNELEFCNGNRCCKDSDYSCEQCIKQYFERKVNSSEQN